jgi:hypothetical protein
MDSTIEFEYFDWLYEQVCDDSYSNGVTYQKLFWKLFTTEYTWSIRLDENRAADGVQLRYLFGEDRRFSKDFIDGTLGEMPCNVLEMLVAMVMRCEDAIAEDERFGDRTGQWFWTIIVNLGLGDMADTNYDEEWADEILSIFLNREYEDNGIGCPFHISDPREPMREADLWMQLNWFLAEVL